MGVRVSIVVSMSIDFAECDRARLARDTSYDGRFYTGVHTTGIYCRPVCPVRSARSANVSFFPSAAATHQSAFERQFSEKVMKLLLDRRTEGSELAHWRL